MTKATIDGDDKRDVIDVMLTIIRHPEMSDETLKMAAYVISADARFNTLVGIMKGEKKSGTRIFELIDFAEEVVMYCRNLGTDLANGLDTGTVFDRLVDIRKRLNETPF